MPNTEDQSTYDWWEENKHKIQDWGEERCLFEGQQLWVIIDAPEVKVEDVIIEVRIIFIMDGNIVHQAFDSNRQDIGLDKELGQDEQEDVEEGERKV